MPHSHARRRRGHGRSLVLVGIVAAASAAAVLVGSPETLTSVAGSDSAGAAEADSGRAGALLPPDGSITDRHRRHRPRPTPAPTSPVPGPTTPAPTSTSVPPPTDPIGTPGTGSRAGIYWGVVGDPAGAQQRSRQTLANHTYGSFAGGVPTDRMVTVRDNGATWEQVAATQPGSPLYQNIARWADTLKARGRHTLLAYHHEPELSPNTRFGTDAQYKQAYARVVSIFRARGATNVSFVWQMTDWAFRTSTADRQYAAKWYPGDSYVDVVGADAYNWYTCGHGRGRWVPLETLFGPAVAFAKAHGKQAALPEFGSVSDGRRAEWIATAGRYLAANDQTVIAAFYFNHRPTNPANMECTWPLSNQGEFDSLGALASNPIFGP